MINDSPIDEIKAVKNENDMFELPENFAAIYPPFNPFFIDNPNHHIKMQNGSYYEREKLYKNKGNSNVSSSINDSFMEVRRKEIVENSTKMTVRVDPKMTKEVLEDNLRSNDFNKYPMERDSKRFPKTMEKWQNDKNVNLVLEDVYQSTNTNRGRSEFSFNQELIIGK